MKNCTETRDAIEVVKNDTENSRGFFIRFTGIQGDPGQYEIISGVDTPLTGDDLYFKAQTLIPYGQNLFYNPVPFEMLRTYETKPQLLVTVDGVPAVCHNLTCDFAYINPDSEMVGFTYDETTRVLDV